MSKHPVEIERDRYGFALKPGQKVEEKPKKVPKQKTWDSFLKKISNDFSKLENSKPLRDLIRSEGIPTEIRGKVWLAITKAGHKKGTMSYVQLLETFKGQESDHTKQIEKDLRRTFPDNAVFESEEGIAALRRVLVAYSWTNPEIGYCQSMNFICALFLLFMDEEESFWLLKTTMEEILPTDYYTQGMIGVRTDERVLKELLAQKLPKISQHLEKNEIVLSGFVTAWFMSLYINILPLESALRVFDSLFCEGSKILLRIALALFKLNEKLILKEKNFEGLYSLLRSLAPNAIDSDKLLEVAFNRDWLGSLKKESIQTIRNNVWDNLRKEYLIDRENQSILHFKVEGEDIQKLQGDPMELLQESSIYKDAKGLTNNRAPQNRPPQPPNNPQNPPKRPLVDEASSQKMRDDHPPPKRPLPPRTGLNHSKPSPNTHPTSSPPVNKIVRPAKPTLNPPNSPTLSSNVNQNQPSPKHRSNPPGKRKLLQPTIHSHSSPPGTSNSRINFETAKSLNNSKSSPLTKANDDVPNTGTTSSHTATEHLSAPPVRRKIPTGSSSRKAKSSATDQPNVSQQRPAQHKPNMAVVQRDKQGDVVHRKAAPRNLQPVQLTPKQPNLNISPEPLPNDDYNLSNPAEIDYSFACKTPTSQSAPNDSTLEKGVHIIHQIPNDNHAVVISTKSKQLNQATIRAKNVNMAPNYKHNLADLPPPVSLAQGQRISPARAGPGGSRSSEHPLSNSVKSVPVQRMSVQVSSSLTHSQDDSAALSTKSSQGDSLEELTKSAPDVFTSIGLGMKVSPRDAHKTTETVKVLDDDPPPTIKETTITSPRNNQTITEIFTVTPAPIQSHGPSRAPSTRNFNERITLVDSRFEERFRPLSIFVSSSSFNMMELMSEQEKKLGEPGPPTKLSSNQPNSRVSMTCRPVLYDHVIVGDDDDQPSNQKLVSSSTIVEVAAHQTVKQEPVAIGSPVPSRTKIDLPKTSLESPKATANTIRKNPVINPTNKPHLDSNRVDPFRATNPIPLDGTQVRTNAGARTNVPVLDQPRGRPGDLRPPQPRPNQARLDQPRTNHQQRVDVQASNPNTSPQVGSVKSSREGNGNTIPTAGAVKKPPIPTAPPSRPLSRKIII